MPDIPDSNTLAAVITALGGTPVEARTLQFECPLGSVRDLVPKLNSLGVAVRKIEGHDREENSPTGMRTVVRCGLYRRQASERPNTVMDLLQW
jgi:hypothetical protein